MSENARDRRQQEGIPVMSELISFTTSDGNAILVELADANADGIERATRRPGEVAVEAGRSFDSALRVVRPTAEAVVDQVASLARAPQEVQVEFGLKLTLKAGAVIASTEGEAHIQVSLKWTSLTSPQH
jgi:hypothetical protein